MYMCQNARRVLSDRKNCLEFLRSKKDFHLNAHFDQCENCREMFDRKLSTWMQKDREIREAFEQIERDWLEKFEAQLLAPLYRELVAKGWNPEQSTLKIVESLLGKESLKISRTQMPDAAGGFADLADIPGELLNGCGLPSRASIVCELRSNGYELRVDSEIPVKIEMVFFKDETELFAINVSEQFPDRLVPAEKIRGWTHLRISRKKT